jgi:hypothetical protein
MVSVVDLFKLLLGFISLQITKKTGALTPVPE